jgi:hypothetical protein
VRQIPERLKKNNRKPDQYFSPEEKLYKAIKSDYILEKNGELIVFSRGIDLPNFQVIREKYIDHFPDDVLTFSTFNTNNSRIISFYVGDIPTSVTDESGRVFEFKAHHYPLEENYANSEIVAYSATGKEVNVLPIIVVKKAQNRIALRAKVIQI